MSQLSEFKRVSSDRSSPTKIKRGCEKRMNCSRRRTRFSVSSCPMPLPQKGQTVGRIVTPSGVRSSEICKQSWTNSERYPSESTGWHRLCRMRCWNLGMTFKSQAKKLTVLQINHLAVVERLLAAGVNIESRTLTGESPLQLSVTRGFIDVVERLLAAGANIETLDNEGATPLFWACDQGHLPVV